MIHLALWLASFLFVAALVLYLVVCVGGCLLAWILKSPSTPPERHS